jgi:hypothetical protein
MEVKIMESMPECTKIVEAITPQAGAAITGDYVSLKNTGMAYVVVHVAQGAADVMAITIEQATTVSGAGTVAITNAVPIWSNLDCAASDTLVARTAAVSYSLDAGQKHKMVIFKIDPASLNVASGFDCICVKTAASNAANITSAMYYLAEQKYCQATPPSAILD